MPEIQETAAAPESYTYSQSCIIENSTWKNIVILERWIVHDSEFLARLIAIVTMGQADHAASIINRLSPTAPALNIEALRESATASLRVVAETPQQERARRAHRDGLIFEIISWIAAQQSTNGEALLRDPHLKATTQGLDGLMIERGVDGQICRATIFEDKCSISPRAKFRDEILPAFRIHHQNKRGPELLAAGAALLKQAGVSGPEATVAAARVIDLMYRAYRGSLTITQEQDSLERRAALFHGYEEIEGLIRERRIGATLVTPQPLREWFDFLATQAIIYIQTLEMADNNV